MEEPGFAPASEGESSVQQHIRILKLTWLFQRQELNPVHRAQRPCLLLPSGKAFLYRPLYNAEA